MEGRPRIVAIDDDLDMLRLLEIVLASEGYEVSCASSGSEGVAKAIGPNVSLIVLDLNLPDMDGIEVARLIRAQSTVPVLMLTARVKSADVVRGLDIGADDYLTKPFNPEELCARVRSLLRRSSILPMKVNETENLLCYYADWRFAPFNNILTNSENETIALTQMEASILGMLMRRAGSVISRDEISRTLLGRPWNGEDRGLDIHISRIRKKIRAVSRSPMPIKSSRGKGYWFVDDDVNP